MAFAHIQHLDPEHESLLAEILQRASKMPIAEVTDGMRVEADRVYVMPPNVTMVVDRGALRLSPRSSRPAKTLPIDRFFRSLASECQGRAVGVVLSGTGADGAQGLAAIKDAGGLTFAQDPASAGYDGMPRAAIEAGVADTVADPERIAERLVDLAPQLGKAEPVRPPDAAQLDERSLGAILAVVRSATGLDLTHYRRTTLVRRISRRMLLGGFETAEDYLLGLRASEVEVEALYRDILVNVTEFFREPKALDALQQEAYPAILERKGPDTTFRLWVPGCSKGQEAYSIVISLVEFLEAASVRPSVQMFATDVSAADIGYARAGSYPASIEDKVSPERLARFFRQVPGGYMVDQAIREMCVFAVHDVTKDPPFSKLDVVSFRNVLIYMERPLQRRVLQVLHYALDPGGFLLLGSSETTGGESGLFSVADKRHRLYVRKPGPARLTLVESWPRVGELPGSALEGAQPFSILQEAERVVLDAFAPPGLLVNADLEVLQFRGNVTPFLHPAEGPPELTLTKMITPGVASSAQAAILESAETGKRARRAGFVTAADGARREVEVEAVPIVAPTGEKYHLVLFEDRSTAPPAPDGQGTARRTSHARSAEVADLHAQLDETRRNLEAVAVEKEATNRQLRIAGEKLQTSNEELRTINEEFQTAQEELQSTNEELTTLNDELRSRNGELLRLNDDLDNVIQGVEIPILILDGDLRIRRFTPQVDLIVSIVSTDVGRPVTDFTFKIGVPDLPGAVGKVLRTLVPSQTDVKDADGHWYSMRIRPYRTGEDSVDGIVVAFIDIDALKRASRAAQLAQAHAEAVVETVREPLLTLDPTLSVRDANRAYYQTFDTTPEETIGTDLFELGNGHWDVPPLRTLLEQVIPADQQIAGLEVEQDYPGIGTRTMVLNARKVREAGGSGSILLSMEDITVAKRQTRLSAALNTISLKMASSMDLDHVLEGVLAQSAEALGTDSGLIVLKQDGSWVVKSAFGQLPENLVGQVLDEAQVPVSVLAAHEGEPVLLSDLLLDGRFSGSIGVGLHLRSVMVVPLMLRQETIGSLSFHYVSSDRGFSETDVDFAKKLAALVSLALENVQLYSTQRLIANTLQTALLTPPRKVPGVDFGYLYRSATETASVGGDLYDLFELSDRCVGVLIGDVSGKGVEAATLAGLIKNTIRALSYGSDSPAAVMAKTNEVVYRSTSASVFVTLLLCFLDTESGRLVYCSAGHVPGMVKRAGGGVEVMHVGSPLAGAFSDLEYTDGETSIGKGDVLVLCTDGVTEARRGKELLGEDRLVGIVKGLGRLPAAEMAQVVFTEVLDFAEGRLSDDVAIISLGRT